MRIKPRWVAAFWNQNNESNATGESERRSNCYNERCIAFYV